MLQLECARCAVRVCAVGCEASPCPVSKWGSGLPAHNTSHLVDKTICIIWAAACLCFFFKQGSKLSWEVFTSVGIWLSLPIIHKMDNKAVKDWLILEKYSSIYRHTGSFFGSSCGPLRVLRSKSGALKQDPGKGGRILSRCYFYRDGLRGSHKSGDWQIKILWTQFLHWCGNNSSIEGHIKECIIRILRRWESGVSPVCVFAQTRTGRLWRHHDKEHMFSNWRWGQSQYQKDSFIT